MQDDSVIQPSHEHVFQQDRRRAGEGRTRVVIGITAIAMVIEITAGVAYGSMALLADGLHMASHAGALFIVAWAYSYARRHARDERFSFGTGKVNSLAAFSGALLLAGFSLLMAWESVDRLISPVGIEFEQALVVAGAGLVVNLVSAWILLGGPGASRHGHGHGHGHPEATDLGVGGHALGGQAHGGHDEDHNLRSAYLHVLADGVTSAAAIVALLAGRFWGAVWMDPIMGIVGSLLVAHWSWGLSRQSAAVLLDHQASPSVREAVVRALQGEEGLVVTDLHVWSIGPGLRAAEIAVATPAPQEPGHYRARLPKEAQIVHCTVEVHGTRDGQRPHHPAPA